jgi:hypothetical protein
MQAFKVSSSGKPSVLAMWRVRTAFLQGLIAPNSTGFDPMASLIARGGTGPQNAAFVPAGAKMSELQSRLHANPQTLALKQ